MDGVNQSFGEHDINHASVHDVELGPDHGVDLSVDHNVDLGEGHSLIPAADDEVDPAVDHGLDPAVGHGLDPAVGHGVDPAVGHGLDPAVGHGVDPAVGHQLDDDVDQHLDHADHGLDHAVDQGLDHVTDNVLEVNHEQDPAGDHHVDQTTEDNLEHNAEQISESYEAQKPGSIEDTVAGDVERKWPGWPGESVFRMLVPAQKVGSIIGRRGEFIKKIVEDTRSRIKILDGPPGTTERAVMVSAKEEPDSSLPPAMDGLLRVHRRIIDGLDGDSSHAPSSGGAKISTRLLVPASQAGSLIGKQGGTVKSIQEASACIVRVLGSEELPVFSLPEDRVVEIFGEPAGVHKAVELIASHLRKFLVDRGVIPMFETPRQMVNPQMEHMPPHQPWGPSQGLPAGGGPGYGHNPPYMPPPRQLDSYYPPADLPPALDKQPHQGISAYGREAPMGVHGSSTAQAAPSMITQVTQQMQIPLSYADAVIGSAGTNISYIRRASGATVTIQETRGVPGEMTVEISGTASQVQAAQQFIQNFMAEAAAPGQAQTGGSTDQGYNPYASHGSVYASPPSNPGHAGGYGSVYGSSYGGY